MHSPIIPQIMQTNKQTSSNDIPLILHRQRDGQTSLHHHSKRDARSDVVAVVPGRHYIHFQQNALALDQIEKVAGSNDNNDGRAGRAVGECYTDSILFALQTDAERQTHRMSLHGPNTMMLMMAVELYSGRNIFCEQQKKSTMF